MLTSNKPLWTCPRCGHQFVSRNLSHSCGRFKIGDHFKGKDPLLRKTFDRLVEIMRRLDAVTIYAQKTRIVFMVRVRFGSVIVKKHSLDFGLWLTRRATHPLLDRIDLFGPRIYYHRFRLTRPSDIDRNLISLINKAHKTGKQEHLITNR